MFEKEAAMNLGRLELGHPPIDHHRHLSNYTLVLMGGGGVGFVHLFFWLECSEIPLIPQVPIYPCDFLVLAISYHAKESFPKIVQKFMKLLTLFITFQQGKRNTQPFYHNLLETVVPLESSICYQSIFSGLIYPPPPSELSCNREKCPYLRWNSKQCIILLLFLLFYPPSEMRVRKTPSEVRLITKTRTSYP